MKIILASQSPRRKELLHLIVEDFLIIPADIDEAVNEKEEPKAYVSRMAQEKADAVSQQYPTDLVIASDTTVVCKGEIMGKPESRQEAKEMLEKMSKDIHNVYTAVMIKKGDKVVTHLASAEVRFFELTEEEIDNYLDKEEYADKAGGYGIQGAAAIFVKEVKGDYYSIVGFPVGVVNQLLKEYL